MFRNERFRVFILFPSACALRVRASVCRHVLFVCMVCVGVHVHICVRAYMCARVVVGHGIGAWSLRWASRRRWQLLMGSLMTSIPTSAHILCLDAAWGPVGVSPSMKSPDQEPRRCQPPPSPPGGGEARPECAPPRTDLQDGRTGSPRQTVRG